MNNPFDRRAFMAACSSLGLSSTLFPGVLWGMVHAPAQAPAAVSATAATGAAQQPTPPAAPTITREQVKGAMAVAGMKFDDAQVDMMLRSLSDRLRSYDAVWNLKLPNDVAPAILFNPVLPGMKFETVRKAVRISRIAAPGTPANIEDVAFYTVRQLGELLRTKKISSTALTEMYLERIK